MNTPDLAALDRRLTVIERHLFPLKTLPKWTPNIPDAAEIIGRVSAVTGIPASKIMGHRKERQTAVARWLAWRLIRRLPGWSAASVASVFDCEHSAINHGLRALSNRMETDAALRALVEGMEKANL